MQQRIKSAHAAQQFDRHYRNNVASSHAEVNYGHGQYQLDNAGFSMLFNPQQKPKVRNSPVNTVFQKLVVHEGQNIQSVRQKPVNLNEALKKGDVSQQYVVN